MFFLLYFRMHMVLVSASVDFLAFQALFRVAKDQSKGCVETFVLTLQITISLQIFGI